MNFILRLWEDNSVKIESQILTCSKINLAAVEEFVEISNVVIR